MNNRPLLLAVILLISSFFLLASSPASAAPTQWTDQATGCTPVTGNVDATLTYVYLGVGSTVPSQIQTNYPSASANYIEAWKTGMVGMRQGELREIFVADEDTPPSYDPGDLFFDVTIVKIHNPDATGLTTRNSVVDVLYSLYRNCVPTQTSSSSAAQTTTSGTGSTTQADDGSDDLLLFGGVGLVGLVLFGGVGLVVLRNSGGSSPQSEEAMRRTQQRSEERIQSLKDALGEDEVPGKSRSSGRRQRRR